MKHTKIVLTIALAIGGVVAIGLSINKPQYQSVKIVQSADVAPQVATPPVATVVKIPAGNGLREKPDFDPRNATVAAKKPQQPVMSAEQSEQVLKQKHQQMLTLISQYNEALDDGQRKADIEAKFKLYMADHKKALLAKLQRDEL